MAENDKILTDFQVDAIWERMLQYFCTGGLPEVVVAWHSKNSKLEKYQAIKRVQERIYLDYIADIAKHCGRENAMHIETVFRSIPGQLARKVDGSASKFQFKNVIDGKKSFKELRGPIDWLRRAGLIHQVYISEKGWNPSQAYCKENRFKLYMFDLGILRHLSGFEPEKLLSWGDQEYKGYDAENFVLNEILASGLTIPCAWREGDSELEFLLESESGIIPVEVKSGRSRRTRSLQIFIEKYAPQKAIILAGKQHKEKGATQVRPLFRAGSILSSTKTAV